jgi:tetratricopeptide (TPR) repeat protein
MSTSSRKLALKQLIEQAQAEQHSFRDGLSQAQRSAMGTPDHWSAKDVTAHIIFWNDRLAADMEAATRDVAPAERAEDFNEANRRVFETHRDWPWENLLEFEQKASARLVAALDGLSEDVLDDPKRFDWTEGRPLWWRVAFTVFFHALDHLSKLYIEWGESERAQELQERIAQDMGKLDDSDPWQGTIIYNLACFYALNGQTELAMEKLRRAFELNSWLVDWSKEDSDLDSLRNLPDFQALYEEGD